MQPSVLVALQFQHSTGCGLCFSHIIARCSLAGCHRRSRCGLCCYSVVGCGSDPWITGWSLVSSCHGNRRRGLVRDQRIAAGQSLVRPIQQEGVFWRTGAEQVVCPPIWRTFRTRCRYHESGVTAGGGRSVFLGAEERAPGLVDAPKGNRSKPTPLSTNRTKERPPTPSPRRCGQSYRGLVTVPIPSTAHCRTI